MGHSLAAGLAGVEYFAAIQWCNKQVSNAVRSAGMRPAPTNEFTAQVKGDRLSNHANMAGSGQRSRYEAARMLAQDGSYV